VLTEIVHHLAEAGAPGLFGRLHVHILFDDPDAF
jgi:hypothetical protein